MANNQQMGNVQPMDVAQPSTSNGAQNDVLALAMSEMYPTNNQGSLSCQGTNGASNSSDPDTLSSAGQDGFGPVGQNGNNGQTQDGLGFASPTSMDTQISSATSNSYSNYNQTNNHFGCLPSTSQQAFQMSRRNLRENFHNPHNMLPGVEHSARHTSTPMATQSNHNYSLLSHTSSQSHAYHAGSYVSEPVRDQADYALSAVADLVSNNKYFKKQNSDLMDSVANLQNKLKTLQKSKDEIESSLRLIREKHEVELKGLKNEHEDEVKKLRTEISELKNNHESECQKLKNELILASESRRVLEKEVKCLRYRVEVDEEYRGQEKSCEK